MSLQQLQSKIYIALPELKKLGVGCEIQNKVTQKKYKIGVFVSESFCVLDNNRGYPLTVNNKITDFYTIIGKKITLTDVLRWVQLLFKDDTIQIVNHWNNTICEWDLKQNLLENQSIELVEFLNNLKNTCLY